MRIPLFPLSGAVMPGGLLPLRIFEPRYLDMVRDCFKTENGFGVCLIKEGGEVGAAATPYPYGTLVEIIDWDQDAQGLLTLKTLGRQKFRIIETSVTESNLLRGEVELLPEEQAASVPLEFAPLQDAMRQILGQVKPMLDYEDTRLEDAVWLGSRFVELLPLAAESRHELLSMDDPLERLQMVAELFQTVRRASNDD